MLEYPLNLNARLDGPTLIYIDAEGSLIHLTLNSHQVQSVVADWNNQPDSDLAEGEAPSTLSPPLGHTGTSANV